MWWLHASVWGSLRNGWMDRVMGEVGGEMLEEMRSELEFGEFLFYFEPLRRKVAKRRNLAPLRLCG